MSKLETSFEATEMAVERINILRAFKKALPRPEKITKCYQHYLEFGELDRDILIDETNALIDGYVAYLIAKMLGLKKVRVLKRVAKKKLDDSSADLILANAEIKQLREQLKQATKADQQEPAQEPIKLYCVKDWGVGCSWVITKGKIYEIKNGWNKYKKLRGDYAACLFPLVKRPAKVGEWVYIEKADGAQGCYKDGDIMRVIESFYKTSDVRCSLIFGKTGNTGATYNYVEYKEYLVLSGYDGRYEQRAGEAKKEEGE